MNSRNILFLIIIIIIGIAAIAGACWYYRDTIKSLSQPAPQTQTPPDETANWKTYRNEEYGFEIKYPENCEPKESTDLKLSYPEGNYGEHPADFERRIDFSSCSGNISEILVYLTNTSVGTWLNKNTIIGRNFNSRSAVRIGEIDFVKFSGSPGETMPYAVFIAGNGKYIFQFNSYENFSGISKPYIDILSTFKFIESTPSITVISPNGGERWVIGKTYEIKWETKPALSTIDVALYLGPDEGLLPGNCYEKSTNSCEWTIPPTRINQVTGKEEPFSWIGERKIKAVIMTGLLVGQSDESDAPFSIVAPKE